MRCRRQATRSSPARRRILRQVIRLIRVSSQLRRTAALGAGTAVCALVAGGAISVTAAIGKAPAKAGTTLSPRGRHAFAPTVGDWEGTFDGLHASFELIRYPHGTTFGASGYAVADLVYQRPDSCPASLTDPSLSTFVAYADTPPPYVLIRSDGQFPFGTKSLYGALSGPTQAALAESYTATSTGSPTKCSGVLHFALAPAHRTSVDDGTWRLTAQDGSGGSFTVRGGGRIAYGVPLSSIIASCGPGTTPGSFSGLLALFVPPSGVTSQSVSGNGSQISVSLQFRSATSASGQYVATAPGCTPTTLAFTAVRTSAAGG